MKLPRKFPRAPVNAELLVRRVGQNSYRVRVYDLSLNGCKIEFVDRPKLDEKLWVKFEGLEALPATVCWIQGHAVGVEFERPVHPAVFELLLARLRGSQ